MFERNMSNGIYLLFFKTTYKGPQVRQRSYCECLYIDMRIRFKLACKFASFERSHLLSRLLCAPIRSLSSPIWRAYSPIDRNSDSHNFGRFFTSTKDRSIYEFRNWIFMLVVLPPS